MDSSRGHSARRYSELPEEIADIYERQEDFPELTAVECAKLKAFLKSTRLSACFSEQQAARRAGVECESDRRRKRRERLQTVLEFNELRRYSDVEIGRAMPAERGDESKSGSKGRRWSKNLDAKAKAYQASNGKDVPPHPASPECVKEQTSHSDDFTSVVWFGTRYSFTKGQQTEAIRALWEEWVSGKHTLSELTIAEKVGSANDHFRLDHLFRDRERKLHPAWKNMIQKASKGVYYLAEPNEMA